jgi:hypothetical protein
MSKGPSSEKAYTPSIHKYKIALCRHWEEDKSCSLGKYCSFAHGEHELRSINDPLPKDFGSKKD